MINNRQGVAWYEDPYGNETLIRDCRPTECKDCDTKKSCTSPIKN